MLHCAHTHFHFLDHGIHAPTISDLPGIDSRPVNPHRGISLPGRPGMHASDGYGAAVGIPSGHCAPT